MLTRPDTAQVLEAVADELQANVASRIDDEVTTVTLSQVDQLLRRMARRAAHEIGWMTEEIAAIDSALGRTPDPAERWHLADVSERYSAASAALGDAIEEAFANGDGDRVAELKTLLDQRITTEQEILGQLEFLGRG